MRMSKREILFSVSNKKDQILSAVFFVRDGRCEDMFHLFISFPNDIQYENHGINEKR